MLCSIKTLCRLFLWNAAGICSAGGHRKDNRSRAIWRSVEDASHRVKSNGQLSSLWPHGQRRQCFLTGDSCNSTLSLLSISSVCTLIACHVSMFCCVMHHCFYSASALLAMQSAVLARGIPSVRPSRSGIVSKRMKIRSCSFQHLVGQSL